MQRKLNSNIHCGEKLASRQLEKLKAGPETHRYEVKLQKTIEDKYLKSMEVYFDLYALTNELEMRKEEYSTL